MPATPDSSPEANPLTIRSRGMRSSRLRTFCPRCQHVQLFRRIEPHHLWHLVLTVLTGGLWLVSWLSVLLVAHYSPWRCPQCDYHLPRAIALTARRGASRGNGGTDRNPATRGTAP